VAQAGEGDGDLLLVAAADAISDDKHIMPGPQQVNRGLRDTDVALDADNDAGEGPCRVEGVEGLLDLWGARPSAWSCGSWVRLNSHHGKQSLVEVAAGLDAIGDVEAQLRACLAQTCAVLCGCEDGDVEDLTRAEQFLGGSDDLGELVDGGAELFLQVADAGGG
jgi:hypothetical protein